jgi:signal transduction histidine kinase
MRNWFDYSNNIANTSSVFGAYKELPTNRAVVIINPKLDIVFCNETFTRYFFLNVNDTLHRLNPNSELLYLIKGFVEKKYLNLTSEISIGLPGKPENLLHQVILERVFIESNELLFVSVESLENRRVVERKINALHNALDHGRVPILITNADKRIVYLTHSFEEVFSKEFDTLYNLTIQELFYEFLQFDLFEEFKFAVENNLSWKKVISIKGKSNIEYWEFTINPFVLDDGLDVFLILSATNLTEHISQTKIIENSEKRQKLIIENISDLLLILKPSGSKLLFENANDNFCKLFQLDKHQLTLLPVQSFLNNSLTSAISKSLEEIRSTGRNIAEFNYTHNMERVYKCIVTFSVSNDPESIIYIVTMKDVTEENKYREQLEKNYQKELQLNKMKSDFLANISHEIRTPYNGIIGYSEIIDDCIANNDYESIKELIVSMKEVMGRALNLFTNLVEVSHIEAGEVEIEKVELNCNQVLNKIYNKRLQDARNKNLEFKLEYCSPEVFIEVDWVKLEKIIDVLIDNAIKYTLKGFVALSSKVEGRNVVISITDSGIGFDKSHTERLLTPFTQEVEGYSRPYEGMGLGLTVAYKLTKLLGGKFEINSEKNHGTEVKIIFPKINEDTSIAEPEIQ